MKRYFTLVLSFLTLQASIATGGEKLALTVHAEAAILINCETGAILYEKNAHAPHYPASTTKIATALYALKTLQDRFDDPVAADQDCIGTVTEEAFRRSNYTLPAYLLIPDGSHIGIKRGEVLSVKDLFYGMMVSSGDDAANVIAKYASGTIPEFVEGMNQMVKELGCDSTTFYNPHGLHHPNQKTTAYDLAIMTQEAMKNPVFCELVRTVRYTRPKTNKQEPSTLVQTNRLLRPGPYHYPKAIGVKTGSYSLAGNCLVSAATDGDRTLIAVLLKTPEKKDVFLDSKKLFEAAFSQPKVQRVLARKGPQKFTLDLPGGSSRLTTYLKEDVAYNYYPAEEPVIKSQLIWEKQLTLPVKKDQAVGEVVILLDGGRNTIKAQLYAQETVKGTFLHKVKSFFTSGGAGWVIVKIAAVASILAVAAYFFLSRRH